MRDGARFQGVSPPHFAEVEQLQAGLCVVAATDPRWKEALREQSLSERRDNGKRNARENFAVEVEATESMALSIRVAVHVPRCAAAAAMQRSAAQEDLAAAADCVTAIKSSFPAADYLLSE